MQCCCFSSENGKKYEFKLFSPPVHAAVSDRHKGRESGSHVGSASCAHAAPVERRTNGSETPIAKRL